MTLNSLSFRAVFLESSASDANRIPPWIFHEVSDPAGEAVLAMSSTIGEDQDVESRCDTHQLAYEPT